MMTYAWCWAKPVGAGSLHDVEMLVPFCGIPNFGAVVH